MAGMFDTQDLLFQKLALNPADLLKDQVTKTSGLFDTEEVLISQQFALGKNAASKEESDEPFSFKILTVSRRVTVRAIQHGFKVNALSIDEVDPISDPANIYTGAYPFSRKIHLLTRPNPRPEETALLQFILSSDGQALVQQASYLPLPVGQP